MEAALKAITAERGDRGEIKSNFMETGLLNRLNSGLMRNFPTIYHQSRDALLAGETWGEKI